MPTAPALARPSPWTLYSAIVAIVSVLLFLVAAWAWPWRPGRIGGLMFGVVAAALYVNAGLYPWRRRWNARPLGTARRWLQLHVHGSTLATLFVVLHIGWRWPAGTIGWLLFGLSMWTGVTGLAGVWLQRAVPRLISRRLTVEAIYERIPELVLALAAEADVLMNGAPETLARAYAAEIRPALNAPRFSLKWVTGTAPDVIAAAGAIERLRPFAGGAERQRLADLAAILQDKADLDAQLSLQGLLRAWLRLHVVPGVLLIGFLIVHVVAVVWH